MINIAWPWIFLLLPLPWLVWRFAPPAASQGQGPPALYAPFVLDIAEHAGVTEQPGRRRLRAFVLSLIWVLLLCAAARPQWLGEPVELPETGRSLMLAVDVSGSMKTPDLDLEGSRGSRLDVVKQVAGEFLKRRTGDRLGLVLFGTRAYLQAPLTFDRKTVAKLLEEALIGIAGKQTAIGDAIGLAVKRLRGTGDKDAVLILITDGANTAGAVTPRKAAELASQAGIRIYTIGVGARQIQVSDFFGTRTVNPSQDLDEDTLKYIAQVTGGRYFRATDMKSLEAIYRELDRIEPVKAGSKVVRPVTSLFYWPLGMAFSLSLLWGLFRVLKLLGMSGVLRTMFIRSKTSDTSA